MQSNQFPDNSSSQNPEIEEEEEKSQDRKQENKKVDQTISEENPSKESKPHNNQTPVDFDPKQLLSLHVGQLNFNNHLQGSSIGNFGNQISDNAQQNVDQSNQRRQASGDALTKPLPQKPKILPEVEFNELYNCCNKLREDSLVIITCSDSRTSLSVAYSLAENMLIANKRLLTGEWGALKQLTVETSIDNLIVNPKHSGGEPTLIIIDAYEMQTFLDSLIVRDATVASLKEDLKDRKIFCICLAESSVLKTTIERKGIKLIFPHWDIPFEEENLDCNDEYERSRKMALSCEDIQNAISLYETSDALKKVVLYVAAFFQNLNIGDFERIIKLLLSEQTILISEPNSKVEDTDYPTESPVSVTIGDQVITFSNVQKGQFNQGQIGSINQLQNRNTRLLKEIWEEEGEQILKSCYLELTVNEYGSRIIDFSLLNLRGELRKYFEDVKFIEYRNKFQKLIGGNLLFDESPQVAKTLRDLSVSMMILQPGTEFWANWLETSTTKALERSSNNRKKIEHTYYCIADLLRETLDYSELEDLTGVFLERLFATKRHDAVLSISKRLRFSPQPQFDEYYWLKQSIDRGTEDVRRQAYQILYNQLKQSNSRVYETLEKISTWLPNIDVDPEKYSPSNKYALQLLLEYLIETLEQFDQDFYGEKIFSYPLFGGLRSDESVDYRIRMLIKWLLHPGIDSIIDDVDSLSIISIIVFPGLFTILFGLQEDLNIRAESKKIAESLVQEINYVVQSYEEITKIEYRRTIVEYWRVLSNYLLEVSNYEIRENKNWNQGDSLNYRRNIIDYLIEKVDV